MVIILALNLFLRSATLRLSAIFHVDTIFSMLLIPENRDRLSCRRVFAEAALRLNRLPSVKAVNATPLRVGGNKSVRLGVVALQRCYLRRCAQSQPAVPAGGFGGDGGKWIPT